MTYATIGRAAQRVSQLAFLHLLEGSRYSRGADAVGRRFQDRRGAGELEDREVPGAYHRPVCLSAGDGCEASEIETTRPS
jgi:valyl-tRNA synthetase